MKTALSFFGILVLALVIWFAPGSAYAAGCDGANIIFSEIDYDQPGTDSAEFIELHIPAATTISSCELRLINGSTPSSPTLYRTIDLAGTYASGKYLVISSTGVTPRDITIGGTCSADCIQNGTSDGFALVDTSGAGTLVWFLSYEGQITNYNPGDGSSNSSTNLPVSEDNNAPNNSINNGPAAGVDDSYTSTTITPGNIGPNAISLRTFNSAASSRSVIMLGSALAALGGLALFRRRRA